MNKFFKIELKDKQILRSKTLLEASEIHAHHRGFPFLSTKSKKGTTSPSGVEL